MDKAEEIKDSNETDKLLRLKKYETPGEDYFAEFAENFKERQRSELLKQSSLTGKNLHHSYQIIFRKSHRNWKHFFNQCSKKIQPKEFKRWLRSLRN